MKDEIDIEIEDRRGLPPAPSPIPAATAVASLLAIAQQGAMVSNLAFANQVSNTELAGQAQAQRQQSVERLRLSILAKAAGRTQALAPAESRAAVAVLTGNQAAQTLLDLRAVIVALASKRRPR